MDIIDDNNATDTILPLPLSEDQSNVCEQPHLERGDVDNQINEVVRIINKYMYLFFTTNHLIMFNMKDIISSICVSDLTTSNIDVAQVRVIKRNEMLCNILIIHYLLLQKQPHQEKCIQGTKIGKILSMLADGRPVN